jgi:ADP-ribose pyrophosphatase YjhB (NUDIX family)
MRYGISAAAIVTQDRKVLLVNHRQVGSYDFWVPPGGGLDGEESIFECARRETLEETGLSVDLERIVYIQEFVEPGYHFCKFFILCRTFSGTLTLENKIAQEDFLIDARFFSRDDMKGITVYPEILKDQFWTDLEAGFPATRYLGLQKIPKELSSSGS